LEHDRFAEENGFLRGTGPPAKLARRSSPLRLELTAPSYGRRPARFPPQPPRLKSNLNPSINLP